MLLVTHGDIIARYDPTRYLHTPLFVSPFFSLEPLGQAQMCGQVLSATLHPRDDLLAWGGADGVVRLLGDATDVKGKRFPDARLAAADASQRTAEAILARCMRCAWRPTASSLRPARRTARYAPALRPLTAFAGAVMAGARGDGIWLVASPGPGLSCSPGEAAACRNRGSVIQF